MMTEKTKQIITLLEQMDISYDLVRHPAVYTIEEMQALNLPNPHCIAKNLFIRDDKKQHYFLIIAPQDKKVELKKLRDTLKSRPLTFASEKDLESIMGLSKGAVSPLGIINDTECKVKVILDKTFEEGLIGIHPNENVATLWMGIQDLITIMKKYNHTVEVLAL